MIKHLWKPKSIKRSQLLENNKLQNYGLKNPVRKLEKIMEDYKMGIKIKGEKANILEDGNYIGQIIRVEFKEDPYAYTEIIIKEDKTELELKCSIPTKITEYTALGTILMNMGIGTIEVNKEYDVENLLVGKKVSFIVISKKTEKGTFSNIVPNSLKPIKK